MFLHLQGTVYMLPTDSGIYELQTVFPDSANIFYTDANTKERIFYVRTPIVHMQMKAAPVT